MMVMPTNNAKGYVHYLAGKYPGKIGWLIGPGGWRSPPEYIPYALDNARFAAFINSQNEPARLFPVGDTWSKQDYLRLVRDAQQHATPPRWIIVPDVVGDAKATLTEWDKWTPELSTLGWPLAIAAQDGMTPEDVRATGADVCFLGGTTEWKRENIWRFCQSLPRVHVGRINTERWLWKCDISGAESCDGTGWFRGDKKQLAGLTRYLRLSALGLTTRQKEVAYAETFRKGHPA